MTIIYHYTINWYSLVILCPLIVTLALSPQKNYCPYKYPHTYKILPIHLKQRVHRLYHYFNKKTSVYDKCLQNKTKQAEEEGTYHANDTSILKIKNWYTLH